MNVLRTLSKRDIFNGNDVVVLLTLKRSKSRATELSSLTDTFSKSTRFFFIELMIKKGSIEPTGYEYVLWPMP